MKLITVNFITIAILLCFIPSSRAALVAKSKQSYRYSILTQTSDAPQMALTPASENNAVGVSASLSAELPRGRGNGKQALISFFFGFASIIPLFSLIFAPFAYINGFKNTGRIRKRRGFAIAGIILATIGLIFTAIVIAAIITMG